MKFINPIFLIKNDFKQDEKIGGWIKTENKRKIFADISSISLSEFYNAKIAGMKPELKINVREFEYKGEEALIFSNVKYVVIRTYNKGNGIIEIVCSEFLGEKIEQSKC